ncbi:MAG: hypothetical protein A2X13_04900 [Bacteroidetes bacterium GWC2_33_15]|nr:MAG: hypothetical protein A2X10_12770 [Bacteroidetes bacterium GWA2_33_15]OFX50932.1 MAG: hypothetical protein A2X13_04900 [Bacteroidetes bacterium GWC2_33_15]OFX66563.1 MAG: hypothetical protein A2X15_15460 [Bacteroidetes bacterium GWB2_32_14]OFX70158.1 MAG: hypothetical protein A2X14_12660 [Bacteroidetes bacterium GWD2_33_33]HAN20031.1 hypothetical protein [Bacteroidales bacterium]
MKQILLIIFIVFSINTSIFSQGSIDVESIVDMGNDLIKLNDYNAALEKFNDALNSLPGYSPAIDGKANVYLLLEDVKEAGKIVEDGIKKNPDFAPFYLTRGKVYIIKGRFEDAIDDLNRALDLNSQKNDKEFENMVYVNRGAAYQKLFENEKALQDYSKAIEMNPDNPNVYMYRGVLYYQNNEFNEAILDFNKTLEIDEQNHFAYYNRGMAYLKLDDNDKSCRDFHKACELGNTNACKMVVSRCLNLKK